MSHPKNPVRPPLPHIQALVQRIRRMADIVIVSKLFHRLLSNVRYYLHNPETSSPPYGAVHEFGFLRSIHFLDQRHELQFHVWCGAIRLNDHVWRGRVLKIHSILHLVLLLPSFCLLPLSTEPKPLRVSRLVRADRLTVRFARQKDQLLSNNLGLSGCHPFHSRILYLLQAGNEWKIPNC